jgi:hypothetical protein
MFTHPCVFQSAQPSGQLAYRTSRLRALACVTNPNPQNKVLGATSTNTSDVSELRELEISSCTGFS